MLLVVDARVFIGMVQDTHEIPVIMCTGRPA